MRSVVRESVIEKRNVLRTAGIAATLAILWLLIWGGELWRAQRAYIRAQGQMERGLHALAVDTLDDFRAAMVDRPERCKLLLAAYVQTRRMDRIEWAAQACFDNGNEIIEVPIALAIHHELTGRVDEGVQILSAATQKFGKGPEIYAALAQLLKRQKRDASLAFKLAAERAGDNLQLILDAAIYLGSVNQWAEAKPLADALKVKKIDNPEVKLFLARVFLKSGDSTSSRVLYADAMALAGSKPEVLAALTKEYGDVIASANGTTPPVGTVQKR